MIFIKIGLVHQAQEVASELAEIEPDNEVLKKNLELIKQEISQHEFDKKDRFDEDEYHRDRETQIDETNANYERLCREGLTKGHQVG